MKKTNETRPNLDYRPFAEVISTYRSRFNGLSAEYQTVMYRWKYLSSILSDKRILPDLSDTAFSIIQDLLNDIDDRIVKCEEIAKSTVTSRCNLEREREMNLISGNLVLAAHLVGYMKSGFSQRTDFLEIPYVIAGQPLSLETHWGDEQYLIAADNLISNYCDQLNLAGYYWSGFTSYTIMHPSYNKFPGATYANAERMFHVTLGTEMRYFLSGFLVLSHELGHAAIECREIKIKEKRMPAVIYLFLWWLYENRRLVYFGSYGKETRKKKTNEAEKKRCKNCFLRQELGELAFARETFGDFLVRTTDYQLVQIVYEIASDIIGQEIAGEHYIRAFFDYAFGNISDLEDKPSQLNFDFETLFIRIAACAYFAQLSEHETVQTSYTGFQKIAMEVLASVAHMPHPQKENLINCLLCTKRLGRMLGYMFAVYCEHIFSGVFTKSAIDFPRFHIERAILGRMANNESVAEFEPRQIVSACFEMMRTKYGEPPVALFSLANNSRANVQEQKKSKGLPT